MILLKCKIECCFQFKAFFVFSRSLSSFVLLITNVAKKKNLTFAIILSLFLLDFSQWMDIYLLWNGRLYLVYMALLSIHMFSVCILLASVMLLHVPACAYNAHQHVLLFGIPIIFISLFPYIEHFVCLKMTFCCFKKQYNECVHINNLFFWINTLGLNMDLHITDPIKKIYKHS